METTPITRIYVRIVILSLKGLDGLSCCCGAAGALRVAASSTTSPTSS